MLLIYSLTLLCCCHSVNCKHICKVFYCYQFCPTIEKRWSSCNSVCWSCIYYSVETFFFRFNKSENLKPPVVPVLPDSGLHSLCAFRLLTHTFTLTVNEQITQNRSTALSYPILLVPHSPNSLLLVLTSLFSPNSSFFSIFPLIHLHLYDMHVVLLNSCSFHLWMALIIY